MGFRSKRIKGSFFNVIELIGVGWKCVYFFFPHVFAAITFLQHLVITLMWDGLFLARLLLILYQIFEGSFRISLFIEWGVAKHFGKHWWATNKYLLSSFPKEKHRLSYSHLWTRMHSSRMRTGRSLTVCCSLLPGDGVSACRGGFSLPGGGLPARGCSPCRGGSACRGGLPGPGGWGSPEPPPVNRITDTCKNITLATTSLRPVMKPIISCYV